MDYNFRDIEKKWQQIWKERKTYRVENGGSKPKYYALDMFPYPSGAGLHVGHPLGYIASDIVSRYKRLQGYNVLHPMGFDSFGLPAEQYAIQTGQHPEKTTKENIARYIDQMNKIGFSFDWDREVWTSNPDYYKWTQWIFLQIFGSWYNNKTKKAESIDTLISIFEKEGFTGSDDRILTGDIEHELKPFTAEQWKNFSEKEKSDVLMNFRLAYLGEAWVNWCPQLGTVLANDEVKDGVSERGGYPVERKRMPQWSMRITAYADRLLNDLDGLDWTESMKEAQRNWIGRSEGSSLRFKIQDSPVSSSASREKANHEIEVFTTRPDTVFGVTFVTLAPEHELIAKITTADQKKVVDEYVTMAKNRSERERMADVKKVTGAFTGAYVIHPFTNEKIPVWTGDYVLAGYGTGAVMGVPAHDSRDYAFAKHFSLPIKEVVSGGDISKESYDAKEGKCINSDFLNGLDVKVAVKKAIEEIEKRGLGKGKVNYRLRDAAFGRQRYWGEPIPIYYKSVTSSAAVSSSASREQSGAIDLIPCPVDEESVLNEKIKLPEIEKFLPTETGEPPLARAEKWFWNPDSRQLVTADERGACALETTTMPGWAGSSWYYLRYMDPKNEKELVSKDAVNYWKNVDLYIGGTEHATGHLLYVRFWTKFLFDRGIIPFEEPAQKLINQGMIQGVSAKMYVGGIKSENSDEGAEMKSNIWMGPSQSNDNLPRQIAFNDVKRFVSSKDVYPNGPPDSGKAWGVFQKNVPIEYVEDDSLNMDSFIKSTYGEEFKDAVFILKDGFFYRGGYYHDNGQIKSKELQPSFKVVREVEKMSKSKWNVITPDSVCDDYGADTLRMYEMFLGPLEQSKPWNTNGITGVFGFLKKFWKLFIQDSKFKIEDSPATDTELKILNRTLKKISDDIDRFSFNTCVSQFMICLNELTDLKCNKRAVLEPLVIALSPFAPHIAEELWEMLGHKTSVTTAAFPKIDEKYLVDDSFNYPVQINGKKKAELLIPNSFSQEQIKEKVLMEVATLLDGKTPSKFIVVPKRIINIVVN